jgi:hypothetical protein
MYDPERLIKNKRFENGRCNINNLAVNVIITIVVTTTEDQKLCWFKNGSYVNESPLLTWSNSTETQIQS